MADPAPPARRLGASSSQGTVEWVRHPADVARAAFAALIWLVVAGLALAYPDAARDLSASLVLFVDGLPESVAAVVVGLVQLAAIVGPVAALLLVRAGRLRELALAAGAAAVTALAGVLLSGSLADGVPEIIVREGERPSWVTGSAFPSATYLAAVAAVVTVLAPTVGRSWRRLLWGAVGVVAVARVVTAVESPIGLTSSIAAGVFIGSIAMVAFRAPLRWPSASEVERALAAAGLGPALVAATDERHRHGPTYRADTADGRELFVKLVGRDERDAEVMTRVVRAVRAANPGDRPHLGSAETIEHEALCLLLAARAGASVPEVVAVTQTEDRSAALVMARLEGRPLDEVAEADALDDAVLDAAFEQLHLLHRARIAHGWPSLHHVWVGPDGSVSLIDLRWSTLSATDLQLALDLAELLSASAALVGVERTVAAARRIFSPGELGAALPLLQPLAVAPETRKAVQHDKGLLGELRTAVQGAAGVDEYEMVKLERLTIRKVVVFAATLVLANLLLSMLGNAGEIWEAVRQADPAYVPLLLLIPLISFPAGALSLLGAVTTRLPFLRTTQVMFAQSFLNRFTPANAGGMALRARFLQRSGVPLVNAASSVAITSAASGVMQVVLGVVFFTWAGRSAGPSTFSMPSGQAIAIVVLVLLVLLGIAFATAFGRKLLGDLRVSLASVVADLRTLGGQPTKLVMLFAGAGIGKLAVIITFTQTMRAFGLDVDFPVVAAMYLAANTVASAAPTPGGVGAIEAALTAGLVGLDVDPGEAAAVVLVFRTFSYWLPIIPCWAALTRLERSGAV